MAAALISGEEIRGAHPLPKAGARGATGGFSSSGARFTKTGLDEPASVAGDRVRWQIRQNVLPAPGNPAFVEVGSNHPSNFVSELNLEKHCWTSQQWHPAPGGVVARRIFEAAVEARSVGPFPIQGAVVARVREDAGQHSIVVRVWNCAEAWIF
jgi:hypothetical protein